VEKIKKSVAERYDLEGDWDEMIYTCHNPTNSDVYFDLFSPLVVAQQNVPNTPTGYVLPPVLQGGAPQPLPTYLDYPNINTVIITATPTNSGDGALAYDSVHNRMYMGCRLSSTGINVTWDDDNDSFTDNFIFIAFGTLDQIVSMAVSATSHKLCVIQVGGTGVIIDTDTNTITDNINLLFGTGNKVSWNSINNKFYVTIAEDKIYVINMDGTIGTTISTPIGVIPNGISFKESTNEMFITYEGTSQIAKIDCYTNSITTILNTATANPTDIIYNSVTDLLTYGSETTAGARTFNATSLSFEATVFNTKVFAMGIHTPTNTLYIMGSPNIIIANGTTLATLGTIGGMASLLGNNQDISFYENKNEMVYNINAKSAGSPLRYGLITVASALFYITGTSSDGGDYNVAVRDFLYSPCWVRRIYVYSKDKDNFNQSITHIYKDANGNRCKIPKIPSLTVGVNQFQGWMAELDLPDKDTIFGINQWYQQVLIKKHTELTFLLIYKQLEKSHLLSMVSPLEKGTLCNEMNSCPNLVRKWSEKDLYLYDTAKTTPFKQNMFKGQKSDAVKPFSFDMLRDNHLDIPCTDVCAPSNKASIRPLDFSPLKKYSNVETICDNNINCQQQPDVNLNVKEKKKIKKVKVVSVEYTTSKKIGLVTVTSKVVAKQLASGEKVITKKLDFKI